MSIGHDKPITVGPFGIGRVVVHVVIPQHLRNISHSHWRTRMTRIGFLYRVHAQGTNSISKFSTRRHSFLLWLGCVKKKSLI
ncbi:hypothetical protein BGP_3110 [Beggiatoa sp. PS]|nr:hypothetical protein BGP_3110 [Beggiatoa sp. PS]